MSERAPQTSQGQALLATLAPERWSHVVSEAVERARVFDAVMAHHAQTGQSLRGSVALVAPGLPWPTFVRWKRRCDLAEGETWERLLDERVPPPRKGVSPEIQRLACTLRRVDPGMNADTARTHLVTEFGAAGDVSDAWLRRVWKTAGLKHVRPAHRKGLNKRDVAAKGEEVGKGPAKPRKPPIRPSQPGLFSDFLRSRGGGSRQGRASGHLSFAAG